MSDPSIPLMRPSRRLEEQRWEVSRDGVVLGHVQRWSTRRGSVLYRAFALHPSGVVVNLESSSAMEERVTALAAFADDPEQFSQHLPWSVRREMQHRAGCG